MGKSYYSYYDYLENYYEDYYDYYYEYIYWPYYYANYNGSNSTYNGTYPPSPYKYSNPFKLPFKYVNPPIIILTSVCAIISLAIFILVCYKLYYAIRTGKSDANNTTIILTMFSMITHLGQNIVDPIAYYYWFIQYNHNMNDQLYVAYDIFWCFAKLSLYFLFIYRYYAIFEAASMLSPTSNRYKNILFGSFVFVMILQCSLYLVYMLLRWEIINVKGDYKYYTRVWLNIYWTFLAIDILLIGVLAYLLTQSILKVVISVKQLLQLTDKKSLPSIQTGSSGSNTAITKTEMELGNYVQNENVQTTVDTKEENKTETIDKTKTVKHVQSTEIVELMHTTTRIALTSIISMISSFIYQFVWLIAWELENMDIQWHSYTWCVDGIINMLCIYLSTSFAGKHYKTICHDLCKCHQCCLKFIEKIVSVASGNID